MYYITKTRLCYGMIAVVATVLMIKLQTCSDPNNEKHNSSPISTLWSFMMSIGSVTEQELDETEFRFTRTWDGQEYVGKPFNKTFNRILHELGLFRVKAADAATVLNTKPIIISAFSSNHYGEARTLMNLISEHYNQTKVMYIYDLGLNDKERAEINTTYSRTVIEVRQFPFHKYPDYVRNLGEYRWKPLLIAQILTEHANAWYMDSSIQMKKPLDIVYEDVKKCLNNMEKCKTYPWILIESTGHSVFSATNPKMYKYLPIPAPRAQNVTMCSGGLELIYGLKENKEKVLRYWVLCALEKDCMAPEGSSSYCQFQADRMKYYAQCHRYDQSAINILVSWITGFDDRRYFHPYANDALKVVRG